MDIPHRVVGPMPRSTLQDALDRLVSDERHVGREGHGRPRLLDPTYEANGSAAADADRRQKEAHSCTSHRRSARRRTSPPFGN